MRAPARIALLRCRRSGRRWWRGGNRAELGENTAQGECEATAGSGRLRWCRLGGFVGQVRPVPDIRLGAQRPESARCVSRIAPLLSPHRHTPPSHPGKTPPAEAVRGGYWGVLPCLTLVSTEGKGKGAGFRWTLNILFSFRFFKEFRFLS